MSNQAKAKKVVTVADQVADQVKALPNTSSRIRFLDSLKMTRGDIAVYLGIRYQHVRNVLITPLKRDQQAA